MEAKDHSESQPSKNNICRLEWIAWAMDAARRHKEAAQSGLAREEDAAPPSEE
jgi:hypothetical protein